MASIIQNAKSAIFGKPTNEGVQIQLKQTERVQLKPDAKVTSFNYYTPIENIKPMPPSGKYTEDPNQFSDALNKGTITTVPSDRVYGGNTGGPGGMGGDVVRGNNPNTQLYFGTPSPQPMPIPGGNVLAPQPIFSNNLFNTGQASSQIVGYTENKKYSAYVPGSGTYTSEGKFYPEVWGKQWSNEFTPAGTEKGFADVVGENVYIVPRSMTQYTKSTYEGPVTSVPVQVLGKSQADFSKVQTQMSAAIDKAPSILYKTMATPISNVVTGYERLRWLGDQLERTGVISGLGYIGRGLAAEGRGVITEGRWIKRKLDDIGASKYGKAIGKKFIAEPFVKYNKESYLGIGPIAQTYGGESLYSGTVKQYATLPGFNKKLEVKAVSLPYERRGTSVGTNFLAPTSLSVKIPNITPAEAVGGGAMIGATAGLGLAGRAAQLVFLPGATKSFVNILGGKLSKQQAIAEGLNVVASTAPFGKLGKFGKQVRELGSETITVKEEIFAVKPKITQTTLGPGFVEKGIVDTDRQIKSTKVWPMLGKGREESLGRFVTVSQQSGIEKFLKLSPRVIYEGNPNIDKKGYKEALKLITGAKPIVKSKGNILFGKPLTEKQAKETLRLVRPNVYEPKFVGPARLYSDGNKEVTTSQGEYIYEPIVAEYKGIKSRQFAPFKLKLAETEVRALPDVKIGKNTLQAFEVNPTFEKVFVTNGKEFQKLSQAGRTKQSYYQKTFVKSQGGGILTLPKGKSINFESGSLTPIKEIDTELFSTITGTRKITPTGRLAKKGDLDIGTTWAMDADKGTSVILDPSIKVTELPALKVKVEPSKVKFTEKQAKEISKTLKDIFKSEKVKSEISVAKSSFISERKQSQSFIQKAKNIFVKPPKIVQTKVETAISIEAPKTVGGTGRFSYFYGKGNVNSNEVNQEPLSVKLPSQDKINYKPESKVSEGYALREGLNVATKTHLKQRDKFLQPESPAFKEGLIQKSSQFEAQSQRQGLLQMQAPQLAQAQRSVVRNVLESRKINIPNIVQRQPIIRVPTITSKSKPSKFSTNQRKKSSGYLVLTYKRKKPILVSSTPLSRGQAIGLGVQTTKGTERASFKLVPTQRAAVRSNIRSVSESELWGSGYRRPVRRGKFQTSDIFVQRKPTRMGTIKETRAIQSHKRGKSIW